jgi:hypothetical protein
LFWGDGEAFFGQRFLKNPRSGLVLVLRSWKARGISAPSLEFSTFDDSRSWVFGLWGWKVIVFRRQFFNSARSTVLGFEFGAMVFGLEMKSGRSGLGDKIGCPQLRRLW